MSGEACIKLASHECWIPAWHLQLLAEASFVRTSWCRESPKVCVETVPRSVSGRSVQWATSGISRNQTTSHGFEAALGGRQPRSQFATALTAWRFAEVPADISYYVEVPAGGAAAVKAAGLQQWQCIRSAFLACVPCALVNAPRRHSTRFSNTVLASTLLQGLAMAGVSNVGITVAHLGLALCMRFVGPSP